MRLRLVPRVGQSPSSPSALSPNSFAHYLANTNGVRVESPVDRQTGQPVEQDLKVIWEYLVLAGIVTGASFAVGSGIVNRLFFERKKP